MTAQFNLSELANPFTPSAFLPPDLAFETDIARYILIGGTAVRFSRCYSLSGSNSRSVLSGIFYPTWVPTTNYCSSIPFASLQLSTSSAGEFFFVICYLNLRLQQDCDFVLLSI